MFEAGDSHVTGATHRNSDTCRLFVALVGEEHRRIEALAGTLCSPRNIGDGHG